MERLIRRVDPKRANTRLSPKPVSNDKFAEHATYNKNNLHH